MTDPYLKYNIDDLEFIEWMKSVYYNSSDRIRRNKGNIHQQLYLGWENGGWFWHQYPDMLKKVEALTYPYGEPVQNSWIKQYNENDFSCLHKDEVDFIKIKDDYSVTWTNSILLEQSENIDGGMVVLAGDGWHKYNEINSRLITLKHEKPGDTIVWDSEIVHGISKINEGRRMTLIVIKGKEK